MRHAFGEVKRSVRTRELKKSFAKNSPSIRCENINLTIGESFICELAK